MRVAPVRWIARSDPEPQYAPVMTAWSRNSVRRELTLYIGTLFAGGLVVAVLAFILALPFLETPNQVILFLTMIVAADLVVVFLFVRGLVARMVLRPLEVLAADAERIAEGDLEHRVREEAYREFRKVTRSINHLTERLITDQRKLEDNVRSLDRTNQELVETTEQLVHAARMASVGTLAAGIAHEVGNPLGATLNYLDLARSRAERGEDPAPMLVAARDEARRIDRIVRSLLQYARPESESHEAEEPREVSLATVVDRAVELLDAQGVLQEITVERDLPADLPAAEGDPQHMEQVVVNLLLNAAESLQESGPGPTGGTIRISGRVEEGPVRPPVRRRRKDDPPGADYSHRRRWARISDPTAPPASPLVTARRRLLLEIEDDGPGISSEALPRIFDPFFSTKEPGRGVGLGLALSARLAEGMGGSIEAENREEGGARFRVTLPLEPTPTMAER